MENKNNSKKRKTLEEEDFFEVKLKKQKVEESVTTKKLKFQGSSQFRQRIICSTICQKPITISDIRQDDETPGISEFEKNFLQLIESITNGCRIVINVTGTTVTYFPGYIDGGKISHICSDTRAIGYYLEALICLAPFGKQKFSVNLSGITNDNLDLSVDIYRNVSLKILQYFGVENTDLKIKKRGAQPLGGGLVTFKCTPVKILNSVTLLDEGKIKRIRGIAYSTRMSPQTSNRVVESAKSVLSKYVRDCFIYCDHFKGVDSGKSPGFGCSLVSETVNDSYLSTEWCGSAGLTPEDLGLKVAKNILKEINRGGYVDTSHQWLVLLFMVLCPEDVSKVRLGKLTQNTKEYLDLINTFFGITFKFDQDEETDTVVLTCIGAGYSNINKRRG